MLPISTRDRIEVRPLSQAVADASRALEAAAGNEAAEALARGMLDRAQAALDAAGDAEPVYWLRPPTLRTRAAFRRDMQVAAGEFPSDAELLRTVRQGIAEEAIDPAAAGLADRAEAELGEPAVPGRPDALAAVLAELDRLASVYEPYRAMVAARGYWGEVQPFHAARHFLAGWSRPEPLPRRHGAVAEDAIDSIPLDHLVMIGLAALKLFAPSGDQAKNSGSPSP